ncbi:MAG: SEC-C metal-binding domain-containing protein [Candidatus Pristimantibacillus lignocellulolyticus]|uniref:SEC-C metal-binding domain-containing protein n=1 Tax=Candidatus Pristimantibacillus lignocellulolyticus TaxID=2994561 RepID=A0A9J6ZDT5_9BACL|nr:MAG: SEC-C metal-binding domain-containing protein [Candidatus Pristimantibacillus lignocellulolyticus]
MKEASETSIYHALNIEYAIHSEAKHKLAELLTQVKKEDLIQFAKKLRLVGYSKLNKEDLVVTSTQHLANKEYLVESLMLSTDQELEFWQDVYHNPEQLTVEIIPGKYRFLQMQGILYSFYHQEKLTFVIPAEIKALYDEIDWNEVLEVRKQKQLVLQYILSASHLYGTISLQELVDLYSNQNGQEITMDEFENIAHFYLQRSQTFDWYNGRFICTFFDEENMDEHEALLELVKDKPRYVPSKEDFLKFADDLYFEITPSYTRLYRHLIDELHVNVMLAKEIIDDVQFACSIEAPLNDIVFEIEKRDVVFKDMKQIQKITGLVIELYNDTRLWSNVGFTPAEVASFSQEGQTQPQELKLVNGTNKIGRNDACLCGSGLKYKKCCGK